MRVWSNRLDEMDFHAVAEEVNREFPGTQVFVACPGEPTRIQRGRWKGAYRHDHVSLRATRGIYQPNPGTGARNGSDGYAASWTEWGWWLVRLFERDPHARFGSYDGIESFHEQTGRRFVETRTPRERQLLRKGVIPLPRTARRSVTAEDLIASEAACAQLRAELEQRSRDERELMLYRQDARP